MLNHKARSARNDCPHAPYGYYTRYYPYTHETTRRAHTSPHRLALSRPRALTHAPPRTDVAGMGDEAEHQAERGSFMMTARIAMNFLAWTP